MRNDELFSPGCPDAHAKRLVLAYALRGLLDDRKCYRSEALLAMQYGVFKEWLAAVNEDRPDFRCCLHEWFARGGLCDAAFIFTPGDLVKYDGRYCVVSRRLTRDVGWVNSWVVEDDVVVQRARPQPMSAVVLKEADGSEHTVNALDDAIEPADIPPEVFALACGKARGCPMLKGGRDGE